jgi:hypothetical protein
MKSGYLRQLRMIVGTGLMALLLGLAYARARAEAPATQPAPSDKQIIAQQLPTYPLDTCVVSGEKFGGDMGEAVNVVVNGRLVRLCCPSCKAELAKDPAKYLAKIDKAVIAKQKPNYPLTTCVVSGEKLDDGAVDYVLGTRLVRLCCTKCIKTLQADPAKYLAKIDDAAKTKAK